MRKSVKLHKLACYLVEHCGLISWLSALVSNISGMLLGDEKGFFLAQLVVITEVSNPCPFGLVSLGHNNVMIFIFVCVPFSSSFPDVLLLFL